MKICILSDFFVPHYNGGGERRYFEIAKRLVERGYSVDVICMKIEGINNNELIEGINIHHIGPKIKDPPYRNAFNFIHFIISAYLWILKKNYDLIDTQTFVPLLPGFLGARIKRIPVIGTIHDVSSGEGDQWLIHSKLASFFEKFLLRLPFDQIITVSDATKNSLVQKYGVKSRRIKVIPNGVDLKLVDSISKEEKEKDSIIYVGRLAPHKHVDDLINAINSLKKDFKDLNLKIIGEGTQKDNLIKLVNNLNLNGRVDFLSNIEYSEVIRNMKNSAILVLPSTREGFGMVLVEANACNLPVIAYNSGGVVEVIEDKKNGFLVEPRNNNELIQKIRFLLQNEDIAREMGLYGRKKAEKLFNWDKIVDRIVETYKNNL
ncbi:MAG: glycosyltransferase family 4 protein [Methanobacterium sp.]